uniref:Peptidase A2 domain-containing protein n=1 Tax=Musca domestica TaxID=7370 RepID=A0A1I8MME9_MUSDO
MPDAIQHNTLVHLEKTSNKKSMTTHATTNVLLATAQVRVKSWFGEYITLRALIDQGTQITSVPEDAAQLLQLPRSRTEVRLRGLGDTMVGVAKSKVLLKIRPRFFSNTKIITEALVLPKLASAHPDNNFHYDLEKWKNITLADPNFCNSERIDLEIGADLFQQILEEGVRHEEKIVAQNTKLGWILSKTNQMISGRNNVRSAATTTIERFWEIEEIKDEETIAEDDYCLKLYEETTRVDQAGRFVLRLPFAEDRRLGESYKRSMARFLSLEKRLEGCPKLKAEYRKTIDELITTKHMVKVEERKQGKYYMPHQAVIRETSLTTKVRVVFDASSKTSNGKSLNDIMHTGPKLQKDIFDIITKWRTWRFVISADVEKMFRQINIDEEDQASQCNNNNNKLTTVTYGTASAPFFGCKDADRNCKSMRESRYSKKNKRRFLHGRFTSKLECMEVQEKIAQQLEMYGFHLRIWIANSSDILRAVNRAEENEVLQIQEDNCLKTLGLQWSPQMDCFTFSMEVKQEDKVTKRMALSNLPKIFDPLGWLTPVTITAKLFIQQLWIQN